MKNLALNKINYGSSQTLKEGCILEEENLNVTSSQNNTNKRVAYNEHY